MGSSSSYWGEGAFDFLFSWRGWGLASGNGGMMRYTQAITVVAMALVAVGALLRLRRRGPQRSIASVIAAIGVTVLLGRVWFDVRRAPSVESYGLIELVSFHFTPSLVVASIAAVVATAGAILASVRPAHGVSPE